ncbi:MAG TPA: SsrA-binding protein [Firmicutes bacterium]|nr:SsrA-binding protein [Bacillota bacterium]
MSDHIKILVNNSKAYFNYFLEDFIECGIELKGTEIKSLRKNGATLNDSYVVIRNQEAYLVNMHIAPYDQGNIFNHDPNRTRKLLLHKLEIFKMERKAIEKSFVIIPTKIYLKKGKAKVEIALGKGKKKYDKREVIKERDDKRMMDRIKKNNGKDIL